MDVKQSIEFLRTLNEDVNECVRHLNAGGHSAFWARAYVRAYGSFIEGAAFNLRQAVVGLWQCGVLNLTVEQQLFFLSLDWRVTARSQIETFEKRVSTPTAIKCLFAQLAKIVSGYSVDFSGAGWQSTQTFYAIRDALTHPKALASLDLSESQVNEIEVGRQWFYEQVRTVNDSLLAMTEKNG